MALVSIDMPHTKEEADKDPLKAAENHLTLIKAMGSESITSRILAGLAAHYEKTENELKRINSALDSNHKMWQRREKELLEANVGDLVLDDSNVEWVVNNLGELGVKIGNQLFFMYKARSLSYKKSDEEDQEFKILWRPVYKREFGEVCQPPPKTEHSFDRGELDRHGYYTFGEGWKDLP